MSRCGRGVQQASPKCRVIHSVRYLFQRDIVGDREGRWNAEREEVPMVEMLKERKESIKYTIHESIAERTKEAAGR